MYQMGRPGVPEIIPLSLVTYLSIIRHSSLTKRRPGPDQLPQGYVGRRLDVPSLGRKQTQPNHRLPFHGLSCGQHFKRRWLHPLQEESAVY
jgi:hypothetical protein